MSSKNITPEQVAKIAERQAKNKLLDDLIQPLPDPRYQVDVHFNYIEKQLESFAKDYSLNLSPDFQRGHVWTMAQRTAFMEGLMRGTVGSSLRVIQFNAPAWYEDDHGGDLGNEIQIIDGLQRLTTVRMYLAGEVPAFGLTVQDFEGSNYSTRVLGLKFAVYTYRNRADLLRYYLSINSGGTPHSEAEIARVRTLLDACR